MYFLTVLRMEDYLSTALEAFSIATIAFPGTGEYFNFGAETDQRVWLALLRGGLEDDRTFLPEKLTLCFPAMLASNFGSWW